MTNINYILEVVLYFEPFTNHEPLWLSRIRRVVANNELYCLDQV